MRRRGTSSYHRTVVSSGHFTMLLPIADRKVDVHSPLARSRFKDLFYVSSKYSSSNGNTGTEFSVAILC